MNEYLFVVTMRNWPEDHAVDIEVCQVDAIDRPTVIPAS